MSFVSLVDFFLSHQGNIKRPKYNSYKTHVEAPSGVGVGRSDIAVDVGRGERREQVEVEVEVIVVLVCGVG